MNVGNFYGRSRQRVTTVRAALSTVQSTTHPRSIIVLPPSAGDAGIHVDSDVEEVPENLNNVRNCWKARSRSGDHRR